MTGRALPKLGFLGIHAGRRTDQPISQNEMLATLFERAGYLVRRSSAVRRPALRSLHQIWSLLSWSDVDVVVVAVFSYRSFWIAEYSSWIASRIKRKKVVLFLHGGKLPEFAALHPHRVRRTFRRADRILAPSDYLADDFRRMGYDIGVIPNVLAIERYEHKVRDRARPNLLWMRTFGAVYDPELALDVFVRVREHHPEVTLTMGGADHGALAQTLARARALGIEGDVAFAGYLAGEAKRRAFDEHDIFLNTNLIDNMPVSVLEAAASGLVPVATAVGGIPALLTDGVDARLVPARDGEAMAAAVLDLLDDPPTYAALSLGARALATQSAWPAVRQRWETELTALFAGGA